MDDVFFPWLLKTLNEIKYVKMPNNLFAPLRIALCFSVTMRGKIIQFVNESLFPCFAFIKVSCLD